MTRLLVLRGIQLGAIVASVAALAVPPGEVGSFNIGSTGTLSWSATAGASSYNVYRGSTLQLTADGVWPRCHLWNHASTSANSPELPNAGDAFVYIVTAVNGDGEGTLGTTSAGGGRSVMGPCQVVMEHHLLDRISYGTNDYVRSRVAAVGLQGFLNEQLNPSAISESSNNDLNSRLSSLTPPEQQFELAYRQMTLAVYARRQLEQVVTEFWNNHFSTDYNQVFELYFNAGVSADAQYREMEHFRWYAFNGTFRELLEMSAFGPAMIPYLDTNENVAGRPNENFARELMELHTMSVDGGYTQTDVREMARVWTGLTVCRKNNSGELNTHNYADPLAGCVIVGGSYQPNFDFTKHDCGAKTLFAGTPQQVNIPATCTGGGAPTASGINDIYLALDAVADHPATKRFISTKLLQKFVTETPTEAMIQAVIARWNSSGGDNRQVLEKVLEFGVLMSPDLVGNKIKTPFEQFAATYRAVRADTNPTNLSTLYNYLARMQMLPHQRAEPTGYGELAKDWINTNDLLERQNFAWDVTTALAFFENIIALMADNGLSSASPPGEIVDFWSRLLFGQAITPYQRERAISFLTTDDAGVPAPVDDARVKRTVAFLMGFPTYLEQ